MKTLKEMTDQEKWEIFPIILEDYNPEWPEIYEQTEKEIMALLGNDILRINHIGSTSVPNLIAKPTIDILIELKNDFDIANFKAKMEELGFLQTSEKLEPLYLYFVKGYTNEGFKGQAFHIHVRNLDDWGELYFRDYLIKHEDIAKEYVKLKQKLMKEFKHHRDNYTNGKTEFIKKYTEIAREELDHKYKK